MTHVIKHLSFGKDYPGIVNPLDGTYVAAPQGELLQSHTPLCVSHSLGYCLCGLYFSAHSNQEEAEAVSCSVDFETDRMPSLPLL